MATAASINGARGKKKKKKTNWEKKSYKQVLFCERTFCGRLLKLFCAHIDHTNVIKIRHRNLKFANEEPMQRD